MEPTYYTTSEKLRLAAIVARATAGAVRGKAPTRYDREIEQIQAGAVEREQAEEAARLERTRRK